LAKEKTEKDPIIAGLLSFLLPGLGYLYIDSKKYMKKALIYILGTIIAWVGITVLYIGIGMLSLIAGGLGFCCVFVYIIPFIYHIIVAYDTMLFAKGEKTYLPEF